MVLIFGRHAPIKRVGKFKIWKNFQIYEKFLDVDDDDAVDEIHDEDGGDNKNNDDDNMSEQKNYKNYIMSERQNDGMTKRKKNGNAQKTW